MLRFQCRHTPYLSGIGGISGIGGTGDGRCVFIGGGVVGCGEYELKGWLV